MDNLQSLKLIDANKLIDDLYRVAFEEDSEDQTWDSGCWLRYRLVRKIIDSQPEVTLEDQLNMIETIGGPAGD